jgi:quinol monooxygenase YgiN
MKAILATLKVQPGKEADFEAAAKEMIANVGKEEPGALIYSLHKKPDEAGAYVFYERYDGQDSIDAHGKTSHMAAFGGKIRDCLAGRPEITMLDFVADVDR